MSSKERSSPYNKKSVHLDEEVHGILKKRAVDEGNTIENVVDEILRKELNVKE
ncbi:MAG: hypothetical protein ACFFCV_15845 [Promethearchaeota archaeon]